MTNVRLYDRDYTAPLTLEEEQIFAQVRNRETEGKSLHRKSILYSEYPKAARQRNSLFPNNYLDTSDLGDKETLRKLNASFLGTLNKPTTGERAIVRHVKENRSYHIIASLLLHGYDFGHHVGTYLFPEFQLGNVFSADYLIVGNRFGGHNLLFVELEAVYGRVTLQDGSLGEAFRRGISQVKYWHRWLQASYPTLRDSFAKYGGPGVVLPDEFHILDTSRIHYAVIAGRRSDFKQQTYRIARESRVNEGIALLHYDNLVDSADKIVGRATY